MKKPIFFNTIKLVSCLMLGVSIAAAADKRAAKAVRNVQPAAKAIAPRTTSKQVVNLVYFTQEKTPPTLFSNLNPFIANEGLPGVELAVIDNNTTGQFTGQEYAVKTVIVPKEADVVAAFNQLTNNDGLVILNLSAEAVLKIADTPAAQSKLLFDAATMDDSLRSTQCRANVLHLLPSRAMRADALAQYLLKQRWTRWFLVTGQTPEDQLLADSLKRAAKRFGIKIVAEKPWQHEDEAHRSEQSNVATFTQVDDYDVLVVADEQGAFGEYLNYRTWLPRPVAGTQGLIATAWHPAHEQWGAVQLQNRFMDTNHRWMTEQDYGGYLAVRAIGEASVRTKSNQVAAIKEYLLGNRFTLQGYKGKPLSFRSWDKQLRQPVLLVEPKAMVAVAPVDGFLHPKTELDTLGFDEAESGCKAR